jgi:large subunit ribosomal protein L15e
MGAYKYIAETLQKQYKERSPAYRAKVIAWRAGPAMVRVERPSNLTRARRLGYQAKQGYVIVRARVDKGRRTRRRPRGGRKQKNYHRFEQPQIAHQTMIEQRVNRRYKNLEVLNSYWVGEDGNYKFYEVILADPSKASVNISSVIRQGKAFRGLTSSGNSRGKGRKRKLNKKLRRKKLVGKVPKSATPYVKKEKKEAPKLRKRTPSKKKPKKAAVKAAPKAEVKKEAPKAEAKKEAPKKAEEKK